MSRIVFVNGSSSSGKTTITKLLQNELHDPPWILVTIDSFMHMFPEHAYMKEGWEQDWFPNFITGFHQNIATFARAGVPVIVDHIFFEPDWLENYMAATGGLKTIYVGLFCPLEVLEERERKRGDRGEGRARRQYEQCHRNVPYDLHLDTDKKDPKTCVEEIIAYLKANP